MNGMIDETGEPTPSFRSMISDTVENWIKHDDQLGNHTQFIVTAVQEKDGRRSYWGLIDVQETPKEDLFVEIERRFYCAYRTIGEDNIHGFGIMDVLAVLDRVPLPRPPQEPPSSIDFMLS